MDFRRQKREYVPIHINRTAMEKLKSFKFLSLHVTGNLKCTHTDSVVKKAQQRLFNLRRLKTFRRNTTALLELGTQAFYRCTIDSILSGCITACYSN